MNRVFRGKPGGLVVDYLGLADQLNKALFTYTESGGQGKPDGRRRGDVLRTETLRQLRRRLEDLETGWTRSGAF